MKKIIQHIRKQSEEVKRHILHIFILVLAVLLFFLWVYSLGKTLTNSDTQEKMSQDLKPFAALKDNMVGGYQNITNSNTQQ